MILLTPVFPAHKNAPDTFYIVSGAFTCILSYFPDVYKRQVHSREGCYLYLKDVERGETEVLLGAEEKEALEQALGYKERKPEV